NISNETFNDSFLPSIEGQYQFDLAPKLKSARSIDGINFQWPKFRNIVTIVGETEAKHSAGQFNSNLEAEKLALICSYQQCQSKTAPKCSRMLRPIGHCCEICGSMLRFRATLFNFDKFQKQVENYKKENRIVNKYELDIASLRIDHNDSLPQYQIVVLAREDATHPFDEQIYRGILKDLAGFVQNNFGVLHSMTVTEIEEIVSVDFHSFVKVTFEFSLQMILYWLSFHCLPLVQLSLESSWQLGEILILPRLSKQNSVYEAVHWRGAKTEDELELLRNEGPISHTVRDGVQNSSMKSASEYSSTFENIAFDEEIVDDIKEK
uniref:Protein amnionless n=1 Tax=Wuchereria bancrofti TaxID=6293 RepID=A0A1I8EJE4_WUCBA